MKYELLLFDADGTLFDYDYAEQFALEETLKEFGVKFNSDLLSNYREVNSKIWLEFEQNLITAADLKVERFRRYFEVISMKGDPQKFSDRYLINLSKSTKLLAEAEDIVKHFYGQKKISLITNGLTSVQKPRFKNSAIYPFINSIIISEELGISKPDAGIFEHAMRESNHIVKKTTIIIGDNLGSDIKGGLLFGIDTCWYNPANKENNTKIEPTFEINSLSELTDIIK